ncbi:putative D-/L-hydantoinase subunit A [Colletotrichum sp. SAR 10_70]|nr:putative D-/L-hydantoinase subunit A [Colletotrichum sp. SAR 10_70]KAI8206127.1 putative D-/L-hydantoinase subunit A [Colletotrichum sp. SAR 10_65]KAI8210268.1 putative D-/L-hydantoinase subunit A [Colletotrichum sp. SAR 10_76]
MGEMPPSRRTVRIGVDVGGTNTDAVAIDLSLQHTESRGVLAHFKTPTTPDATSGIETAVRTVLAAANLTNSPERIASVTIGTTHFINAVIERDVRRLQKVGVLRLSKSFLREVPAFAEFPPDLAAVLKSYVGIVDGGLHIDGSQEAPVIEAQVVAECAKIRESGVGAVVISGVYSPIDEVFGQEEKVRDIILREVPGIDVVCSKEASASIGFIERENAAILNGAILRYARKTVSRFRLAIKRLNLTCPLFLTQNDGTILDAASAAKIPIRTFSSGPTNSMRGAAYLAGLDSGGDSSAIVVDIGGTTSDVGVLLPSGMPRQASAYVTVAGVRVNYSMPHLHSIGLGGGSIVRTVDGKVKVGPESVGLELLSRALVFGGDVCTTTDVAVAAGKAVVGATEKVKSLEVGFVEEAISRIKALLEGAVDVIKTSPDPVPVLLVGGGAILSPDSLKGASKLIRPPFHDVANAVGAAIARVCGAVDIVQGTTHQTEGQAIDNAKKIAIERAIAAGAIPESIKIAEVETMPLQYVANQVRTLVKAVGDIDLHAKLDDAGELGDDDFGEEQMEASKDLTRATKEEEKVDPASYKPDIKVNKDGIAEWIISETDLDYLADGCYVLGCAGGGSPAASKIQLRNMLREGHTMRVIEPSSLKEKDLIYWGGHMGSPAVSIERLQSIETVDAFRALMEYMRHDKGKIMRVERRLFKGHSYGEVHIAAFESGDEDEAASVKDRAAAVAQGGMLKVPFKNENILAEHTSEDGKTSILAAVPDLISILDNESGRALGVPEFKYGYRVTVIGITCSPRWTETQAGLDIGGPRAFGYDMDYKPLGKYVEPRSVIQEYTT